MIIWFKRIIKEVKEAIAQGQMPDFIKQQDDIEIIGFPAHLYDHLLYLAKNNVEIAVSPVALNESEAKFIEDLRKYHKDNVAMFSNKKLYIIRNRSKKGVGFFEDSGFYPDFIMWLFANDKQYITFIDPHGLRQESITSSKVNLYKRIKTDIQSKLADPSVVLNSFILSPTKYAELPDRSVSKEKWIENNVLFMEGIEYIEKLFAGIVNKT